MKGAEHQLYLAALGGSGRVGSGRVVPADPPTHACAEGRAGPGDLARPCAGAGQRAARRSGPICTL